MRSHHVSHEKRVYCFNWKLGIHLCSLSSVFEFISSFSVRNLQLSVAIPFGIIYRQANTFLNKSLLKTISF